MAADIADLGAQKRHPWQPGLGRPWPRTPSTGYTRRQGSTIAHAGELSETASISSAAAWRVESGAFSP